MKKGFCIILSSLFILGFSACSKEEPLSQLEAVQQELLEMDGYSCTATLTRTSNKGETIYGTKQLIKSTGEYKLELTSPPDVQGNYTLFDGTQICQYNPRLDSKIIKDVPESQHRNELFLNQFIQNYMQSEGVDVTASTIDESHCVVLEAVIPGTDSALATEKLWIDSTTLLPVRLALYDINGEERYCMDYDEFTYNPEFPEDIFIITE